MALTMRSISRAFAFSGRSRQLDTSPYHLCRVFREGTGLTLHAYRLDYGCARRWNYCRPNAPICRASRSSLGFQVTVILPPCFVRASA